ncbi:unnamed protein product [Prunus armeniaca]
MHITNSKSIYAHLRSLSPPDKPQFNQVSGPNTRSASYSIKPPKWCLAPTHTSGRTRPRTRSVNTPANPKTPIRPSYLPLIRRDAPGHVRGLSTRRLIQRRVRPHTITWAWLHSHQPSYHHISHSYVGTHPATYGVCQHAGQSKDACDLTLSLGPGYILTSHHTIISPTHTSGRTRPRTGSVNTPANPKTRATSHYHLGLATFSPAIIPSYLPLIRRDAPGHVRGLSTRRLIQRRVRPHTGPGYILTSHHTIISPTHTSGRSRPRTGSVNTPANPKTRATSHYHLGLATFSPAIIPSYLPLIRRDAPGHVRGLSTRRLIQRRVRPHTITWAWLHSHQPSYHHLGLNIITIWGVRGVVRIAL